jgi:hypothetical protein
MSDKSLVGHTIVERIFEKYGTGAKVKTAVIHLDERAALARRLQP